MASRTLIALLACALALGALGIMTGNPQIGTGAPPTCTGNWQRFYLMTDAASATDISSGGGDGSVWNMLVCNTGETDWQVAWSTAPAAAGGGGGSECSWIVGSVSSAITDEYCARFDYGSISAANPILCNDIRSRSCLTVGQTSFSRLLVTTDDNMLVNWQNDDYITFVLFESQELPGGGETTNDLYTFTLKIESGCTSTATDKCLEDRTQYEFDLSSITGSSDYTDEPMLLQIRTTELLDQASNDNNHRYFFKLFFNGGEYD